MKKIFISALILAQTVVMGFNYCYAGSPLTNGITASNNTQNISTGHQGYILFLSPDKNSLVFTAPETANSNNGVMKNILVSKFDVSKSTWGVPSSIVIDNDLNKTLAKEIFFAQDEKGNKNIYSCFYMDGKCSAPTKLNENVNSKSNETFAFLSPDKNVLYYTSDRVGGKGGYDLWKSERLESGDWGIAQNLGGKVNTEADEESPVILSDNATLFFSSKGHNTSGGFDIFTTTLSDEGFWSDAENLGASINTINDDLFYFLSRDEKNAFYTSTKKDSGKYIYEVSY